MTARTTVKFLPIIGKWVAVILWPDEYASVESPLFQAKSEADGWVENELADHAARLESLDFADQLFPDPRSTAGVFPEWSFGGR